MTVAAELIALIEASLWLGFLVFLRVAATVAMLPAFGEQSVPARIKLVLALAFTVIVAPAIEMTVPEMTVGMLALYAMTETVSLS